MQNILFIVIDMFGGGAKISQGCLKPLYVLNSKKIIIVDYYSNVFTSLLLSPYNIFHLFQLNFLLYKVLYESRDFF